MNVPFLNLRAIHEPLQAELCAAFQDLLDKSDFVRGKDIDAFEEEYSSFAKVPHCVSVANGTDAIVLALKAAGLKAGDEVITAANTFIATVEAASVLGIRVKLVDVDSKTLLMSPEKIEKEISSKTRAIIPVHLYGQMPEMGRIREIAQAKRLTILEDAAQAHGAKDDQGCSPGDYGIAATYSFFPGKNLGAFGDAGCIVTRDAHFAEHCKKLRNHGGVVKYQHEIMGYNSRLDTLQAKILRIKLRHLEKWNSHRQKVAGWYSDELGGFEKVQLPFVRPGYTSSYHLYVTRVPHRDQLQKFLAERKIETGLHYPAPIHLIPACRDLGYKAGDFPVSESAGETMLSLPMCPTMSRDQVSYVAENIREFYRKFV